MLPPRLREMINDKYYEKVVLKNTPNYDDIIKALEIVKKFIIREKTEINSKNRNNELINSHILTLTSRHEVKIREVSKYPALLVDALLCFINNEELYKNIQDTSCKQVVAN